MKKLKLIFGLLMVAAFVAVSVLTIQSTEKQAIKKSLIVIPSQER
ncbi:hypothetical protein [Lutibacter sp. HS1-25]|nr:hypothetical protein [Lutibacter sp. HS1-25]